MAICTRCHKEMGQMDTVCPHCGYDFPILAPDSRARTGFAYSRVATLSLVIGQFVAGLGCLMALIGCAVALAHGDLLHAFVLGPIAALLMLGIMVVFVRTLDAG